MTVVNPTQSNSGDTIEAADINTPINQIAAVVNGAIDATNIADSGVTTPKIADSAVTTAKVADANITNAKLAAGNRQNSTSNSTHTAPRIDTGWGFIATSGVSANKAITFATAFSVMPIVVCSFLGKRNGADPTTPGDAGSLHDATTAAKAYQVSTTGFTMYINTETSFSAGDRAIFSWIAIGAA